MNLNITEEFVLTEDVQDIERRFWSFYLTVIKDYFDLDEDFICLEKEAPNHGNNTKRKKNYRIFNQPDKLLRFCIQDTCLGLRKFYASFVNYIEIINYLSKKNLITIYCVLGKSLFAALGICIVIDEAVKQYGVSHGTNKKQIELIVTEIEKNWRTMCVYVVDRVNSCYKNVEIKLEFIDDYSTRLSVEAFRAIKEVDIVVMSRYLSHFPYLTVRTHFLEVILKRMKELSILFYLDSHHGIYYRTLKHQILKTDSLIEVMSQKTMYELVEDAGSEEYCLEFSFLYTTGFEKVMFSTCIKCHGIKDNSCFQNNIQEDISSFRNSERDLKLKICDRFKKENLLPSPEVKYIFISSKYSSDVANGRTDENMASGRKILMKSSKNIDDANIPPKMLQVTTCGKKNKKKPPNHPGNGKFFTSSTPSTEFEEESTPNAEITKTRKDVDILSSTIPRNKYKYHSEGMKPSAKTCNVVEKLSLTNLQNNYNYSKAENKPCAKNAKISNVDEKVSFTNLKNNYKYPKGEIKPSLNTAKASNVVKKLSFTNLQNNYEYSKEEKKPSVKIDKTRNLDEKLFTNLQNNNKYSKEEKKPFAKATKTSNGCENLSFTNLQNNYKYSKEEKKPSVKTDKTSNLDEIPFTNLHNNNKYSKKEKKPFAKAAKTSNDDGKLSFTNLQNNYKPSNEENKQFTEIAKTSNDDGKLSFTNLQNNYKPPNEEKKQFTETAKTSNVGETFSSTNLQNNYKYFNEENKPSAKTTKTSNFVEKLASKNSQNKCKYSRRKKKSNAETGKIAIENLTSTNLRNENKYFKEEKKRNFETVKTNRAGLSYTYARNKYKYLEGKKKLNAETVKTNKVVRKFYFVHLQVKCKYSGEEEKSNVETRKTSKAVQKLASTKQQSKNEYKCPHLQTAESVSNYAELLSEIYYFKHFGKKSKYFSVYS